MRRVRAESRRRLALLAALIAVSALLVLVPARLTAPARVLFNESIGWVQTGAYEGASQMLAAGGTLVEMFRHQDRLRALGNEAMRLRNENTALVERLRRLELRLQSAERVLFLEPSVRVLQAPVSSYDTSGLRRTITVRAGNQDGVQPGMAVAAQGALVGVVQEAGPWQCRVRLVTDPFSAVPCRLGRDRLLCVLQGTGTDELSVEWIGRDSFAEPGDVLVTASLNVTPGHALRIPDGLPAATVLRAERDKLRPMWLEVKAAPRVDLSRLEAVEILQP